METTNVLPDSPPAEGLLQDRIRRVVKQHAGLKADPERLEDSTDLYRAGMTSQSSVVLMIAIETEFDLEFPDAMLNRDVFSSIGTIANAVRECSERGSL